MSGNLTISNTDPRIIFVDTNNNPDFTLHANGGEMQVENSGSGTQVKLESSGSTRLFGNVIANKDLDVDGHTELDNTNIVGLVTVTNVSSGIGLKLIDASSKQFAAGGGGGGTPFAGSFTGHDFRIQVGGNQNAIFKYAAGARGNLELGPSSGIGITSVSYTHLTLPTISDV